MFPRRAGSPLRIKSKQKHPERDMCIQFMNALRIMPQKIPYEIYHIANERKASVAVYKILKALGVLAGVFDYHIIAKGFHGYIEFKVKPNELTDEQVTFCNRLILFEIPNEVAYSLDEGLQIMKKWGLIDYH